MGDKGNFYVMDDDYIEQKYVRAEEERQRREEQEKRQREIAEQNAFVEAERQRKAAEGERLRRQEEDDRRFRLEEARKRREEEEELRKKRDQQFQERLSKIRAELSDLDQRKSDFVTEKLAMMREINDGEADLKNKLEEVLAEKRGILEKEQNLRSLLQEYDTKAKSQQMAFDQQENSVKARQQELVRERRKIEDDMLGFLRDPSKNEHFSAGPPKETVYETAPQHQGYYSGVSGLQQPQKPTYPQQPFSYQPPPQMMPPPQPLHTQGQIISSENKFAGPTYPTQVYTSNPTFVDPTPAPAPKSGLEEQLKMLDSLLNEGVMSKDEYEINKKEALKAAGVSEQPGVNREVEKQIAQLDDYLRQGILMKDDYEDAKARVLEDAKKNGPPVASAPVPNQGHSQILTIIVPPNRGPGDVIQIKHEGRDFSITIPPGVRSGGQFRAQIST